MYIPVIALLAGLEVIIALLAVLGFLWYRERKAHHSLQEQSGNPVPPNPKPAPTPDPESATPTEADSHAACAAFLDAQLQQARDKHAVLEKQKPRNESSLDVLTKRIRLLELEAGFHNQALSESQFWTGLDKALAPTVREVVREVVKEVEVKPETGTEVDAKILEERLALYQERIHNLEQFKKMFFDMSNQLERANELNARLSEELQQHVPQEKRSQEMEKMLGQYERDNEKLQTELSQVKHEFETLFSKMESVKIKPQVREPDKHQIESSAIYQELKRKNMELAEENLHLKNQVQNQDKGSSKEKEFQDAIDVLEDEASFLRQQIKALLDQGLEEDQEHREKLGSVNKLLVEKEKIINDLEEQVRQLEEKILKSYE